jgi:hypothetical protein
MDNTDMVLSDTWIAINWRAVRGVRPMLVYVGICWIDLSTSDSYWYRRRSGIEGRRRRGREEVGGRHERGAAATIIPTFMR